MEDAFELEYYLPYSFRTPTEQEYIRFLWDAFRTNYESEKHQFAFLAYHMLTMSFVYFNIWQIRQTEPVDFAKGLIGFGKEIEKKLLEATTPFLFSEVNESSVLRLLRLIGCDNSKIGAYTQLVKARNDAAHPNGNILISNRIHLDRQIHEVLRVVEEIQRHSAPVIEKCYSCFLQDNSIPDDWEYSDPLDEIREVLIHGHYLSQKDIEICACFDVTVFSAHPGYAAIQTLHDTLKREFIEE